MAGYSESSLVKKLGLKPRFHIRVVNGPANYVDLVHPLPADVTLITTSRSGIDMVHIFVLNYETFMEEIDKAKRQIKQDVMIWISWPKKASRISTDLDENVIRAYGLQIGLVDVKVCAVDVVWSGLKFVIPLRSRVRE
jgi:hypothetical protein